MVKYRPGRCSVMCRGGILRDRRLFYVRVPGARNGAVMAFKRMFFNADFVKSRRIKAQTAGRSYWLVIAFITRLLTKSALKIMHLKFFVNAF